jgi:CDP-paratose 2-epimerase
MTWLVTGGCGFVGTNLCDALLARGTEVAILDNLSRNGSKENLAWLRQRHGESWRLHHGDIRNREQVEAAVSSTRPTVVLHLAAQVAASVSISDPLDDFQTNAAGTLFVLEAVRRHAPDACVLYSSSNKVYGSLEHLEVEECATRYVLRDHPDGLAEDLALDGSTPYGCSKLAGELYVRDYARIFDLATIVFRHSSMYGGRQFATFDQGWVGWFCLKSLEMAFPEAERFTISGNGKQVRDLLEVSDVVQLYIRASERANDLRGRVYNIGGGVENSLSLLELFALLEGITGHAMRFERLDPRPGDQKVFIADIRSVCSDLGWSPTVRVADGIGKMLEWCRGNTIGA